MAHFSHPFNDIRGLTMSQSFEQAFVRLEEILERMNGGKLGLDESLKLYEEADTLIGMCALQLNSAEERIEMLMKKREGQLVLNAEQRPETTPLTV